MRRRTTSPRVLGIDASLTSTGYASKNRIGVITNDLNGMERLAYILSVLDNVLKYEEITHVCMEGYYIAPGRLNGTIGMAELGGAIKLLCLSRGLPTILVPPMTLKKYVTGRGNAKKQEVLTAVKQRWGKAFISSDKADAYALFMFGTEWLQDKEGVRRGGFNKVSVVVPGQQLQSISIAFSG